MRKWFLILVFLLAQPTFVLAAESLLFGGSGHIEFLGCLNCNEYHGKSVWNEMSRFGFKNDYGVWNPFGSYANPFSSYAACGEFASDPPVIVDGVGNAYGRLSINEFTSGSICGVTGNEKLCRALKAMCAKK